jgi:hypothetical protein
MNQVTCYGAYSTERAMARKKDEEQLKLTGSEDEFVSLGLDKYLLDMKEITGEKPKVRLFKCWIEPEWEREVISTRRASRSDVRAQLNG